MPALAAERPLTLTHTVTNMVTMESVGEILQRIRLEAPGTERELAKAAGLSHALLLHARGGERRLSDASVASIASVLREWGAVCARLADELEAARKVENLQIEGGEDGRA